MRPERCLDLLAVLVFALLNVAFSQSASLLGNTGLRTVVGLPMVVGVPGYAIVAAVWPRGGLRPGERLTLSLGVSIALAALGGLVLYWASAGLRPLPWAVLLGVLTLVGCGVAWVRRLRLEAPPESPSSADSARRPLVLPAALMLGAAGLLTFGAVGIAATGANQQREAFSELWLLPPPDPASDQVTVGLRSMEQEPTLYRVQIRSGDSVAFDTSDIELANGQQWQTSLHLASYLQTTASIEAVVYRTNTPDTPYRRVVLRLPQKG